jgi:general secretion pathway protein J
MFSRLSAERREQRGFTLLEVLISVMIFATISLSLVVSMSNSFEIKRKVTSLNERYHEGRQVIRRVTREVRMAFLRAQPPEEVQEEQPAVLTRFLGEEDEIYFANNAHIRLRAEGRESDQSEVAYFLRRPSYDTPYRSPTLFRRESRRVDDRPDHGGLTWPVVDGVKSFKLEYWDDAKEIGDDAWQRSWDSDDNKLLPARVRITLELERLNTRQVIRFVAQAAPKIRRPIQSITEYKR